MFSLVMIKSTFFNNQIKLPNKSHTEIHNTLYYQSIN